jgi:hypothetical protein
VGRLFGVRYMHLSEAINGYYEINVRCTDEMDDDYGLGFDSVHNVLIFL